MRRILVPAITLALVLSGRLALPSEARAQFLRPLNDTISTGVTIGAGLGAPPDGGFEIGGTVDVPISLDLRLRGDAAGGIWTFGGGYGGQYPAATYQRHRVLGSIVHPIIPLAPGRPLGTYVGGGFGVYVTRFRDQPDAVKPGTQIFWGLEYLSPDRRWLIDGEIQVLFVRSPRQSPYATQPETDLGLHAGIAIKRRLR
jgi:hypothetical protein